MLIVLMHQVHNALMENVLVAVPMMIALTLKENKCVKPNQALVLDA